jgi:O-antigen/teichoic acid export membrane protein
MFAVVFGALSCVCIAIGAVIVVNTDLLFGTGLTPAEIAKAKILMAILVVNMVVTLVNNVWYCYVMACERFVFQKLLNVIKNLLIPALTLPMLLLGFGSVAVVTVTTVLTVGIFVANVFFCRGKLKMQFVFKNIQFSQLKEMGGFAFFIFLNQIVNQVNWSVDKLLLGRMSGTVAVAIYGIGMQIYWLFFDASASISGVFIPQVNHIVAKNNDNRELTSLMTRVGRVQFIVLALCLSGFVFFGKPFIYLWAGEGYSESYWVALLLLSPMIVPLIQSIGNEIQRAKNMHRIKSVVYTCIAAVNVVLSVFLIRRWGCIGAAAGTTISLIAGEILFINWYYHKKIGLDMVYFWKEIAKFAPAISIACLFGAAYTHFVQVSGWGGFALAVALYTAVYATAMWLLGLNSYEKQLITKMLRKVSGGKK